MNVFNLNVNKNNFLFNFFSFDYVFDRLEGGIFSETLKKDRENMNNIIHLMLA